MNQEQVDDFTRLFKYVMYDMDDDMRCQIGRWSFRDETPLQHSSQKTSACANFMVRFVERGFKYDNRDFLLRLRDWHQKYLSNTTFEKMLNDYCKKYFYSDDDILVGKYVYVESDIRQKAKELCRDKEIRKSIQFWITQLDERVETCISDSIRELSDMISVNHLQNVHLS